DVDHMAGCNRGLHFGQPVEQAPNAFQIPNPLAWIRWIGAALAEILWRVTDGLKQERAVFIGVVVARDDTRLTSLRVFGLGRKQVRQFQSDRLDDALDRTTGVA